MISIERIFCPIDLSTEMDGALGYAAALARSYKAKLYICHCMNPPGGGEQAARRRVDELIARTLGGDASSDGAHRDDELSYEVLMLKGHDAAEAITREAALRRVDLLVMRSRRRPRRAALLGSTAEEVCRTAPCPVLVTHAPEHEFLIERKINLKRVFVAYDFSNDAELALRYGLSLAQEYQAELNLLHVLPAPVLLEPEIRWAGASTDGAYFEAARRLQSAIPAEAYTCCRVRHAVRWGKPYREILSFAREHEVDLICLGAYGAEFGMGALFGSNVDRVLRQAPCPVLVARPLKPAIYGEIAGVAAHEPQRVGTGR